MDWAQWWQGLSSRPADLAALLLADTVLLAVLLLALAGLALSLRRLRRQYHALIADVDGQNLEELLRAHLQRIHDLKLDALHLTQGLDELGARQRGCLQRVGMVRYDAFDDVGGEASFALAVLDEQGNGFVVNSVFGRTASTTYAKPIAAGRSAIPLADEEQEALRRASGA